ncbi:MAG: FecR domain-containing protein [Acidobacteria bacterium]|nr:FecR domain-containing protein [Acidobacteriota bacterium]
MSPKSKNESYIQYVTVTYRSVVLMVLGALMLVGISCYFIFPTQAKSLLNMLTQSLANAGIGSESAKGQTKDTGQQQAHFTNLDGTVRVKRANSPSWQNASYDLPLTKGDVVQTGPEGIAKVVFADGTNYTIKQDSLIVIEDNSTNEAQQTQVAVQVTTGTVDLNTATYSQGSSSRVTIAGATANFAPESSAQVHNNNASNEHSILVKQGSGEVARNGETVRLGSYEAVSFKAEDVKMTRLKEVGPPTLIAPANVAIFGSEEAAQLNFSWTPMQNTKAYHVKVSKNPYFTQLAEDKVVNGSQMKLSGLPEGAYYWLVQSVDGQGKESIESEHNKFTIISKAASAGVGLEIDPLVQHGHVIEIKGKTDPAARVMVNGEEVPVVGGDGTFRYYTPPLPQGENVITVTAQNSKGGVNTQTKKIVVQ